MHTVIAFVILVTITTLPLMLLLQERHDLVLLWLGATLGADILSVKIVGSIRPFEMVGLIYLPSAAVLLPKVLSTRVGRFLLSYLLLLGALGVLFGYVIPWPDTSGVRPWAQQSGGRAVIYSIRTVSELSVAVYVARQVSRGFPAIRILRYVMLGTTITALSVMIQAVSGFDYYGKLVTSTYHIQGFNRFRGISGEPRDAGQLIAIGLILLLGTQATVRYRNSLIVLHLIGLILTVSTSALILLMAGLAFIVLRSPYRWRVMGVSAVVGAVLLLLISAYNVQIIENWQANVEMRISHSSAAAYGFTPHTWYDKLAQKLEVFDASALLFFVHNQSYLFTGTGPGLISLPGSNYIPAGVDRAIYGTRIDSVPHMGLVLVVADTGLVGLILWLAALGSGSSSLKAVYRRPEVYDERDWASMNFFYLVVCFFYLLQVNGVIYIALGIGMGAAMRLQIHLHESVEEGTESKFLEERAPVGTRSHPSSRRWASAE